ncbi:nuclear transport factor 2 family protein [Lentimicrobium sp. L6]|uniref:nuclear transport factor 2 family protein n=2 Tax=unclassified Lentimicrobium TaxID=2677434 RepID=UPI001C1327BE|nr:nuclear transport factor 2 family protein [Lentimicrobium sp. L6]NPD83889.1 nuclear transport factor 2 family protein [Lentimicrobium sp. L6]
MMNKFTILIFLFACQFSWAQSFQEPTIEQNVLRIIEDFNAHVNNKNLIEIDLYLMDNAQLSRIQHLKADLQLTQITPNELANKNWVSKRYEFVPQVDVRSSFASVYGYYTAFDTNGVKKCGTDYYQLFQQKGRWRIIAYTETIYNTCKSIEPRKTEISLINNTLDEWHGLAAVGDSTYFDYFSSGSFYLGTDPKEVWSLQGFKDFAMPHFRRGAAWSFKNKSRNVHLGDYGHYAWFDEKLDTWMGLCRGSGVMEKQSDGWKIKFYSLTVLVPNSKINAYIKILNND